MSAKFDSASAADRTKLARLQIVETRRRGRFERLLATLPNDGTRAQAIKAARLYLAISARIEAIERGVIEPQPNLVSTAVYAAAWMVRPYPCQTKPRSNLCRYRRVFATRSKRRPSRRSGKYVRLRTQIF